MLPLYYCIARYVTAKLLPNLVAVTKPVPLQKVVARCISNAFFLGTTAQVKKKRKKGKTFASLQSSCYRLAFVGIDIYILPLFSLLSFKQDLIYISFFRVHTGVVYRSTRSYCTFFAFCQSLLCSIISGEFCILSGNFMSKKLQKACLGFFTFQSFIQGRYVYA